jgi:hypothetical protein
MLDCRCRLVGRTARQSLLKEKEKEKEKTASERFLK